MLGHVVFLDVAPIDGFLKQGQAMAHHYHRLDSSKFLILMYPLFQDPLC